MEADKFVDVAQQALLVLALASLPLLLPMLIGGVLLGMLQAATSINETTLSFVPKLVIFALSITLFGSSILVLLTDFTRSLFAMMPGLVH